MILGKNLVSFIIKQIAQKFRIKYLKDFYYKLPMGKGELSYFVDQESKWIEANEDTILSSFINFVCNY